MTEATMRIIRIEKPKAEKAPHLVHVEDAGVPRVFRTWDAGLISKLEIGALMLLDYKAQKSKLGTIDYFLNEAMPTMEISRPNTEKLKTALAPDEVYTICERSAMDTLEILDKIVNRERPRITGNDIGGVFSSIFGVMCIERFKRGRL